MDSLKSLQPREKLLQLGASALTDYELLALLLDTGTKEQNVVDLAKELLKFAGNIVNLTKLDVNMIQKVKGIGPAKACKIVASIEFASRAVRSDLLLMPQITSPQEVVTYFAHEFSALNVEIVKLICLDAKNRIIFTKDITKGTSNMSLLSPKDIYKEALLRNALSIIVMHNHPSGDPTPSQSDKEITKLLQDAGQLVDIPLLDHLIYGSASRVYSMMKNAIV